VRLDENVESGLESISFQAHGAIICQSPVTAEVEAVWGVVLEGHLLLVCLVQGSWFEGDHGRSTQHGQPLWQL